MRCVELNGEDISCYSNTIESVSLRKCPYDHVTYRQSVFKRNHSEKSFYLQYGGKNRLA